MKRIIVMVAVTMMAAVSVNAQNENLHHEVSLSYGLGSVAQLGEGIGEGLASALFSNTEYDDGFILGPISVEYFYHFNNPRLALGGLVSYSKWDSDIQMRSGNHEKVGERKRSQPWRGKAPDKIARLVVGKMPARAGDALDKRGRAAAPAQENRIVVRLERRYVRLGKVNAYRFKRRADVGRVEVPDFAVRDEKADGVAGVVGDGKRLDGEGADLEVLPVLEDREFADASHRGNGVGRHRIGEKPGLGEAVVELRNPLYVVIVAVREHRRHHRPKIDSSDAAALQELAAAETAVYQQHAAPGLDAIRVSRASARERDDPHCPAPLRSKARCAMSRR